VIFSPLQIAFCFLTWSFTFAISKLCSILVAICSVVTFVRSPISKAISFLSNPEYVSCWLSAVVPANKPIPTEQASSEITLAGQRAIPQESISEHSSASSSLATTLIFFDERSVAGFTSFSKTCSFPFKNTTCSIAGINSIASKTFGAIEKIGPPPRVKNIDDSEVISRCIAAALMKLGR